MSKGTFKIFVGKLGPNTTSKDLKPLFEQYGKVVECDVVNMKNYGFVHMEDEQSGMAAVKQLNGAFVNGSAITVEAAKNNVARVIPTNGGGSATTKLFVGNLPNGTSPAELRPLFEQYGTIVECDTVQNYGFVHINTPDITRLLNELNGMEFKGLNMKVQISTSRVRQRPGMGNPHQCYKCGHTGHWSKECSKGRGGAGGSSSMGGSSLSDSLYTRDLYSSDYMARDRLLSYGLTGIADTGDLYNRYLEPLERAYDEYRGDWAAARARLAAATRDVDYDPYVSRSASRYSSLLGSSTYDDYLTGSATGSGSSADLYDIERRRRPYEDSKKDGLRSTARYAPY